MNHNGKRLADGSKPKLEDLSDSVTAWTREISAKCRAYGMPVAVFLCVVPLSDPAPQWAHNMTAPGALDLLSRIRNDVASKAIGIVGALPHDLARKH